VSSVLREHTSWHVKTSFVDLKKSMDIGATTKANLSSQPISPYFSSGSQTSSYQSPLLNPHFSYPCNEAVNLSKTNLCWSQLMQNKKKYPKTEF
jgi:hypothetical protein